MMKSCRIKKTYLKTGVKLKLFERKTRVLKIKVSKIIWKLEFWKLNLRIGILEVIWELEFWKLNLKEIGFKKK